EFPLKKRKNKQSRKNRVLQKAGNPPKSTTAQRASKSQISSAGIQQVKRMVDLIKPWELSPANRGNTILHILRDDAVAAAMAARTMPIELSQAKGKFTYDKNSEDSRKLKGFFEYAMANLEGQTPRSIGKECSESLAFDYSPFENVYKAGEGDFAHLFTLKKLAYIHPLTLDKSQPYSVKEGGNEIEYIRQSAAANNGSEGLFRTSASVGKGSVKEIDFRRVSYVSCDSTGSMFSGNSLIEKIYEVWREKTFLSELELSGSSTDISGCPVLKLPSQLLQEASADPTSASGLMVQQLTQGMASLHQGENTHIILPSDTHNEAGSGALQYDIKFQGVEGGGKNFSLGEMIDQRRRAIFTVFGVQYLSMGENDKGGSYNMLEGSSNITSLYVERDNLLIDEMWNKQVFPRLLELNGWKVDKISDMPKWVSGDATPISLDESSKMLQRCGSAGLLPSKDPVFLNEMNKMLGIEYRFDESLTPEQVDKLTGAMESKSGSGNGTSGTGESQAGGANSATNSENAA
ncbi:MAG: hypothetical protein GY928_13180, partial [Colwellia sp.]|nr:hypothetical protein [Colwellia sp.]